MKNEADLMRRLANEPEEVISPLHHSMVYIIMWQSSRSGGTYTELRKSVKGKNRFLEGLEFQGVDMSEVYVIEQEKAWVPVKKDKKDKRDKVKPFVATTKPKSKSNKFRLV